MSSVADQSESQPHFPGRMLALLLAFDSLHFVFARALSPLMPGILGAFYVLFAATIMLGLYLLLSRRLDLSVLRSGFGFFLTIGALVAGSTGLNYTAVSYLDAGTASLLSQTSTIFALALGIFWLGDRLARREWLGAGLAISGAFVISFQPGDLLRIGALMILSSALLYASHAAIVKRRGGGMDFINFFFFRIAATSLGLGLLAAGSGQLAPPVSAALPTLLLAGLVDVLVSRTLYYQALRKLKMTRHALILTLSPVVVIAWSLVLFREAPTVQALVGGAIVIAGVAILRGASPES
jgi:drug/metabolite transporter (DMT)-like permease